MEYKFLLGMNMEAILIIVIGSLLATGLAYIAILRSEIKAISKPTHRNALAFLRATQSIQSLNEIYAKSKQKYPKLGKEAGLQKYYSDAMKEYAAKAAEDDMRHT
jgi:hypothetical protein